MARRVGQRMLAVTPVVLAWLVTARMAQANEGQPVVVERDAEADSCPDASALILRVREIRDKPDLGRTAHRVHFSRDQDHFHVTIETETGEVRALDSRDATCALLGNAAAVTLALLIDSEPVPPSLPAPAPPPPPPESRPAPRGTHERPSPPVTVTLGASATGAFGVVGPAALGVTAELGVAVQRFRIAIGALWIPTRTFDLAPGHVDETLAGGLTRLCYAPLVLDRFRLDVCSGAWMGVLSARATGYTRDEREARPYVAIPAELALSLWTPGVGVELAGGALLPAHRSDFNVDGLGVAYASPAVAGLASLRVVGVLPLGDRSSAVPRR